MVRIKECIENGIYSGGLSEEMDGEFSILYNDGVKSIMFHVATMMPNLETDKNFTNKKSHIGNDNVVIVFSENQSPFNPETLTVYNEKLAIFVLMLTPLPISIIIPKQNRDNSTLYIL